MGIVYLGLKNVLEAERQYEILKEIKGEDTPALCSDLESEISRYKNNRSNW
jgi:hypothetical protein